jgi:hypothetical protein
VAVALIVALGLSWRLWLSSYLRLFPLSPVADWLPAVAYPWDRIWPGILIALLGGIVLVRRSRKLTVAFLFLAGSLSLWDQTRWQPWFYQYLFMLAAIALYDRRKSATSRIPALDVCRAILVLTYFWSGVQKLNANFIQEAWPDFASSVLSAAPKLISHLPAIAALIIPLSEIAIAAGLASRKFRTPAACFAVAAHVVILAILVSSGENTVVWPWNVAMICFVVILFWRDDQTRARDIFAITDAFRVLVLALFGFLPALSFFGLWDSYLSMALYSGNTHQAVIYVTPEVIDRLPAAVRPHIWQKSSPFFLDVNRWSYGDLNVPLYPEPRIYKNVTRAFCESAGHSPDIKLRIKSKPKILSAARTSEYYDCDHLDSDQE